MFASRLAPWLTRRGIHYGWFMVAMTFLTTICSSAAISLSGILVLPLVQEFGWGRAEIAAVMGLMLLLYAGTAPFAGALMLRYRLCRTVAVAVALRPANHSRARWLVAGSKPRGPRHRFVRPLPGPVRRWAAIVGVRFS